MYEWIEHTGELELAVEAATEADVFSESLAAIGELVGSGEHGEALEFCVELSASDGASLLVDWLNDLVFLIETESFVPSAVGELSRRWTAPCRLGSRDIAGVPRIWSRP